MKTFLSLLLMAFITVSSASAQLNNDKSAPRVNTDKGTIEGINDSGVAIFKGIPFAQPPTGALRWKPPKPANSWDGVRKTVQFGPRCMQRPVFGDMVFRSDGMSEDCLYLNVWTPGKMGDEKLPVLVYFYGGGFIAGDGSEPRYQGESMARNKGIVAVTVNYRLGAFGFMSHPGLTKESPNHASGNYALMDQTQALRWVKRNIAAFGGDPDKVTIAGESAGSISVSALMASPMSKSLFRGAIGESGSLLGALPAVSQSQGEQQGLKFEKMVGANSLEDLRSMSAKDLLDATGQQGSPRFSMTVDGYFFPKSPADIFANGEQAHVPLLVGWNSEEANYGFILHGKKPTAENYKSAVRDMYGEHADKILELYPGNTDEQAKKSATALASDRFIAFSTWKWSYMQAKTGRNPVYRYYYNHPRPAMKGANGDSQRAEGAVHSAEIEYAMGNLPSNKVYDWNVDDFQVSHIMQNYFANFVKNGDPNGLGVPEWTAINRGDTPKVMQIDLNTVLRPEQHKDRYLYLNQLMKQSK